MKSLLDASKFLTNALTFIAEETGFFYCKDAGCYW
jgi:hypothetical protein